MGLWDDFYKLQTQPMLNVKPLPGPVTLGGHVGDTYSDNTIFRQNHPNAVTPEHPLITLIKGLLTPKQPRTTSNTQEGIGGLLAALRNDPVGDYNRLSSLPSNAPNSLSPFNTGFFKTAAQRQQIERDRLGY